MTNLPPTKPPANAGARPFQLMDRAEELNEVINEFLTGNASALIWTKEQEQAFHTKISSVSPSEGTLYVYLPLGFDHKAFKKALDENQQECFFSVSVSKANVFFKTKLLRQESNLAMTFKFPSQLFKAQRRKEMRFTLGVEPPTLASFEDPLNPGGMIKKILLDVSAGGIAVIVEEADAALFFVGLKIRDLSFMIDDRVVMVPESEVRHTMPLPLDYTLHGHKVGIQFTNLPESDAEWIRSLAFEMSKRAFANQVG